MRWLIGPRSPCARSAHPGNGHSTFERRPSPDQNWALPMDLSIPHPTGLPESPGGFPPRRDASHSRPTPNVGEEGPARSRIGILRLPLCSRGLIGLLLLALLGLPWLPIPGPPGKATPARRI